MDPIPAQDPPELIDGRYKLIKPIGQGGMAAVYLVWDQRLRAWRALKILLAEHARDPALRRRFESEAQAMARLEHVNVVRVYDVALDGDLPYISMELVDGGSLDLWLKRHGAMPARLAVEAILQVCDGIAAAHDEGIIHRDVKPHNVLVDRKGTCKVTDFGIARMEEDDANLTLTGTVMGTLGFMAPEQRMDTKLVDQRADVYSIGATLFSLLTGRKKVGDLFAAEEHELADLGVPLTVAPILLKATRYKREQRYDTVVELAQALWETLPWLPEHPPGITLVSADAATGERVTTDADAVSSPSRPSHKPRAATPPPAPVRAPGTRPLPTRPGTPAPLSRVPDAVPRQARMGATAVPTEEMLDEIEGLDRPAPPAAAPRTGASDPPARSNPTLARSVARPPVVYEEVQSRPPRSVMLTGSGLVAEDEGPADLDPDLSPRTGEVPNSAAPTTIAPPAPRNAALLRPTQAEPEPAQVAAPKAAPAKQRPPAVSPPAAAPQAAPKEPEPAADADGQSTTPDLFRALIQPFIVMALVVVVLGSAWVGYSMWSTQDARRSEAIVTATQDALFGVVEAEIPRLRSDLAELGSHTATVEKLYRQFEAERDPAERVRLANQLVAIVGQELEARSKDAPATASYKIPEARNRLLKLQNARSSYDVAMRKLQDVQSQ